MKFRILPVTPLQQNCSLIWCETTGAAALIDPGGETERLLHAVKQEGLDLKLLLLTHAHIDHVGAAGELAAQTGLPIVGPHREDDFLLKALPQQAQMFGFPPLEPFSPDRWLDDGNTIQVGEETLAVIHCPGHTPGHIVFYHETDRIAFVGDVLFNGSIGRTDFPRGDYHTLIHSIRERLLPLGDDVTFVPGHGPTSTFGEERINNPFLNS